MIALDTYTVRVRVYFGRQHHYVERIARVRVVPQRQNLQTRIVGVEERVLVGSDLTLSTNSAVDTVIQVTDEGGNLLTSGQAPLQFTVPEISRLHIQAELDDGLGNQALVEKTVFVDKPHTVRWLSTTPL